jgi:ribosomal-protein-alanine N-acetyltransferase
MKTFIETDKLLIREIVPDDAEAILRLDGDPLVLKYINQNPIQSLEQAQDIISFIRQQYIDHGIGRWAIIEKATKNFIGWTGFKFITALTNNKSHYFDLGYRLIRDYWGKGYASESAIACITYGFQNLLLEEIYAMADIENTPSIKF